MFFDFFFCIIIIKVCPSKYSYNNIMTNLKQIIKFYIEIVNIVFMYKMM